MGCGGSKTDALEPRYLESWTKETESTWLTSTDTDIPLASIQSINSENSSEVGFASEKTLTPDFFDDGLSSPAHAYLKVCSALSETNLQLSKPSSPLAVLTPSHLEVAPPSSGTTVHRRSVLRTEEITKWQDNRMSTKQVTITVTQSIRQVDKNGKIQEKSLTTYETMKPVEALKERTAGNTEVH
ncbi:brain and acute leukemia cytoplasmic protein [Aplochiton taeniatus]